MIGGEPTAADLIRWAHALVALSERWCKGAMARGAGGVIVDYRSPQACSWCGHAALLLARRAIDALFGPESAEDCYLDAMDAIELATRRHYGWAEKVGQPSRNGMLHKDDRIRPISWINDRKGHNELLAIFYLAEGIAFEDEGPLTDDELASLALDAVASEAGEIIEPVTSPSITRKMTWSPHAGGARHFRPWWGWGTA